MVNWTGPWERLVDTGHSSADKHLINIISGWVTGEKICVHSIKGVLWKVCFLLIVSWHMGEWCPSSKACKLLSHGPCVKIWTWSVKLFSSYRADAAKFNTFCKTSGDYKTSAGRGTNTHLKSIFYQMLTSYRGLSGAVVRVLTTNLWGCLFESRAGLFMLESW